MIALLKQNKLIAAGAAALALMALSATGMWQWQSNAYGKLLADQAKNHEAFLRQVAEANAAVILKQQSDRLALEQRLATADKQSTEKLNHALTENDRLERLYSSADDERRRLRIEVKVARADAVVSAATGSGSVGDAASVELSAAAGRTVWDIRRGMIDDQAKLAYLQEWARQILGAR
ncbi:MULTISPECIES: lysis system i-spanin subunit Rz [Stutzerimonas stutzeri subgroup]|uniref:Rac prophage, prophage lambda endopeptidase n=1 Tax=Stutzerimonas stutzeri CCUG 29243 TaxID=1196835 RepID=I4CRD8_STUST|nr:MULTISPECIES: lysis system i-spanin subunit Rz [Stutzerimonas stutzeri subgroup]AFM32645.1 Rac prophage, prophage lambda endopeptidase [Stutzerimonas stutzeri CCUG 29243]MCQ2040258.1 lysis protein [Stutzerimonas kunmingensis]QSH74597.1 lysis protein [Pseudomonas phage vB_PstS-pAN]